MIEKIILDYLKSELSVPVYMEIPEDPPEAFVLIEKTSSSQKDYIKYATFAIQSYEKTLYNAALLNEEVKDKMQSIISLDQIYSSRLNSDYNYTDTSTKKYRYQAVFNLVY